MLSDCKIGDLQSVDGYMNIALERCQEISDGKVIRSWGDAFVRGNNGRSTYSILSYFCFDSCIPA
jgi:U6 snRNA-associated Sm-like protein LSm6